MAVEDLDGVRTVGDLVRDLHAEEADGDGGGGEEMATLTLRYSTANLEDEVVLEIVGITPEVVDAAFDHFGAVATALLARRKT